MNNLDVITTTADEYALSFGFSEEEVFAALDATGLGSEKGKYDAYWSNTSGNELLNTLIQSGTSDIKQTMEMLLAGGSFESKIDEQIIFNQLDENENAIWSLLHATGYLKVLDVRQSGELSEKIYTLALTNLEVKMMFKYMIQGWFNGRTSVSYNNFIKALLMNDVESMNEFMNTIALHSFSSFDIAKGVSDNDAPERVWTYGFAFHGKTVLIKSRKYTFDYRTK